MATVEQNNGIGKRPEDEHTSDFGRVQPFHTADLICRSILEVRTRMWYIEVDWPATHCSEECPSRARSEWHVPGLIRSSNVKTSL